MRQLSPPTEQNEKATNENDATAANTNFYDVRHNIRKRKSYELQWLKTLYKQGEIHHQENIKMQKKFLKLYKEHLQRITLNKNKKSLRFSLY